MTEKNVTGAEIFIREGFDLDEAMSPLPGGKLRVGGKVLTASLAPGTLTVAPECLTRQHLGRRVRFQKIMEDGHAKVCGVIESFQLSRGGYELTLDGGSSGSIMRGPYGDGATVQFI